MTTSILTIGACVVSGVVPGWLLGGINGVVIGAILGGGIGVVADRFQVRTPVAVAVTAAAVTGAFIGQSVVSVICEPDTCRGLEIAAAILTGLGAFIGVGVIAALATRSFDEYREGRDPR